MKFIVDALERLTVNDNEKDNDTCKEETNFDDILDDVMRSIRGRFSLTNKTSPSDRKSRKDSLYKLYSSRRSLDESFLNKRRRHSAVGTTSSDLCKDVREQRFGTSIIAELKDRRLSRAQHSRALISESVARKLEARKEATKTLTRAETVAMIRTKYRISKTSS